MTNLEGSTVATVLLESRTNGSPHSEPVLSLPAPCAFYARIHQAGGLRQALNELIVDSRRDSVEGPKSRAVPRATRKPLRTMVKSLTGTAI